MIGLLKSINEEARIVEIYLFPDPSKGIEEQTCIYMLDDNVKMEWVVRIPLESKVTFTTVKDNPGLIKYIAVDKPKMGTQTSYPKKSYPISQGNSPQVGFKPANEYVNPNQERISKQWALNAAIEMLKHNKEAFNMEELKGIAKELYKISKEEWK